MPLVNQGDGRMGLGRPLLEEYAIPESCTYRFTSLQKLAAKCSSALRNGVPYLAFEGINKHMLDRIDHHREMHLRSSRVLYDEALEILLIKFIGTLHEYAAANFSRLILAELEDMGLGKGLNLPLASTGSARFGAGSGRQMEPDASFRPLSRTGQIALPSFVIQVGVNQTLMQLQCDACMWLTQGCGSVGVVLLIKVDDNDKSIIIEHWENIPRPLAGLSNPLPNPVKVNCVDLTQGQCVGAPISINLYSIFYTVPTGVPNNATLLLSTEALIEFYNYYWRNMA